MGPRPKRPPSSINFRRFSIYCFDSVLHKLKRHKFGKSRTIITMRVSLADNFGILFRIVNAQNNFVQYIYIYIFFYKYYLVQSWHLLDFCKNPSPMTFKYNWKCVAVHKKEISTTHWFNKIKGNLIK